MLTTYIGERTIKKIEYSTQNFPPKKPECHSWTPGPVELKFRGVSLVISERGGGVIVVYCVAGEIFFGDCSRRPNINL